MALRLQTPIIYLITGGATSGSSSPRAEDSSHILAQVRAAVAARIPLVQLREKSLTARSLFELARRAAEITRGTGTRLLVNDRADVAAAAGADGVHLTARSIKAEVVRRAFGPNFVIGVSTHSAEEAAAARDAGADFAVFGPVFDTPSKREYGPPLGTQALVEAARLVSPFPLLALGGVSLGNALEVLRAGASGVAAITLFSDAARLGEVACAVRGLAAGPSLD